MHASVLGKKRSFDFGEGVRGEATLVLLGNLDGNSEAGASEITIRFESPAITFDGEPSDGGSALRIHTSGEWEHASLIGSLRLVADQLENLVAESQLT